MIIANMATYPARSDIILKSVTDILKQVDLLNLCLNEFTTIPKNLSSLKNLNAFIPDKDYKDVGKFVCKQESDDDIFFIDDDRWINDGEKPKLYDNLAQNKAII